MEKTYKEALIESVVRINKKKIKESCGKSHEVKEQEETDEEEDEEKETNE
jgi:hypothetical protein